MSSDNSPSTPYTERTALLLLAANERRLSQLTAEEEEDVASELERAVSKEEQEMKGSMVGERLPYNDYTTIDWLHDLVFCFSLLISCPDICFVDDLFLWKRFNGFYLGQIFVSLPPHPRSKGIAISLPRQLRCL